MTFTVLEYICTAR